MNTIHLIKGGEKQNRKIVCTEVIGAYYNLFRYISKDHIFMMNPGGSNDFGFVKITMVTAKGGSACLGPRNT